MRTWLLPIIFPAEYNAKFFPDSVDTSNSVQGPIFLELGLFEWKHCIPGPKHRNINFMLRCCNINLMKCSDLKIMSIVHFKFKYLGHYWPDREDFDVCRIGTTLPIQ